MNAISVTSYRVKVHESHVTCERVGHRLIGLPEPDDGATEIRLPKPDDGAAVIRDENGKRCSAADYIMAHRLTWRQTQVQRGRKGAVAVYERVAGDGKPYRVWTYDVARHGRVTNTYADTLEQALDVVRTAVRQLGIGDAADKALYGEV